jgi:ketosteroid isomerase-like protein
MAATIAAAQYASVVAESDVELVKQAFEALAQGGYETLLPLIDPDFEMTTPPGLAAEPDTYRGPEGVRRYFDSFYDAMDEIRFEAHDFRDVGEWVVVSTTVTARGRSSGLEFDQSIAQAWRVRDGKAIRLEVFADVEVALAAIKKRPD